VEMIPKPPTMRSPAEWFQGDVYVDVIVRGESPSRMRVSLVRFAPGARTAWHRHVNGQTLHVTEGVGYVQARGGELVELHPGDTSYTPPGEWHWHGAARCGRAPTTTRPPRPSGARTSPPRSTPRATDPAERARLPRWRISSWRASRADP
jgi:quercetin dioxygenase-like cupin family protein